MLIIETNYIDKTNFQSRVIDVESWDYVIKQFTKDEIVAPIWHKDYFNFGYEGVIRPRFCKIENLEYTSHKLYCEVTTYNGIKSVKIIERT